MSRDVTIRIHVESDEARASTQALRTDVTGLGATTQGVGQTVEHSFSAIGTAGQHFLGNLAAKGVMMLGNALRRQLSDAVQSGLEFTSTLSELSAITGIAGDDLHRLGQTARISSELTGRAASDQVEAYKLLASNIDIATIGGVEGLERLGEEVVTLSIAAGIDLKTASEAVAGTINQFGLEASESARVVNALAAGSKFGAAEVGTLAQSMANAGGVAASAGLSVEEVVGTLEVFSQSALSGAEAGTQLRNIITILQTSSEQLAKHGIRDVDLATNGWQHTIEQLAPLLGDANAMVDVFGRANLNAATILLQGAEAADEMTARVTDTNTAWEQAEVQLDNLQGDLDRLQRALERLVLDGYELLEPALRRTVQTTIQLISWLRENWSTIQTGARILGVLTAGVMAYQVALRLSTSGLGQWIAANKAAGLAVTAKSAAVARATAAVTAFNTAIRAHPIGMLISALVAVGVAFATFRQTARAATDELRAQNDQVRALITNLDGLSGTDLFSRGMQIRTNLAEINEQIESVDNQLRRVFATPTRTVTIIDEDGTQRTLKHAEAVEVLMQRAAALSSNQHDLEDTLADIRERGANNLEFQRRELEEQVRALTEQGVETDELVEKRRRLAEVEERIQELRTGQGTPAPPGDDAPGAADEDLRRREEAIIRYRQVAEDAEHRVRAVQEQRELAALAGWEGQRAAAEATFTAQVGAAQRAMEREIAAAQRSGASRQEIAARTAAAIETRRAALAEARFERERELERIAEEEQAERMRREGERYREMADEAIRQRERIEDRERELHEERLARAELELRVMQDAAFSLMATLSQMHGLQVAQEQERLNKALDAVDRRASAEEARILEMLASEELSAEEREMLEQQLASARARFNVERIRTEEEYEEQIRRARQAQAQFEKLAAVARIIQDTASAVTAALPNIPLSILVGAMGAAQLAVARATPVPTYARGGLLDDDGVVVRVSNGELYVSRTDVAALGEERLHVLNETGRIEGPGTGTSDDILAVAEPGGFVVRARHAHEEALERALATARRLPGMAGGGSTTSTASPRLLEELRRIRMGGDRLQRVISEEMQELGDRLEDVERDVRLQLDVFDDRHRRFDVEREMVGRR